MAEFAETNAALVRQLIELHGEEGVCPSAKDWTAILNAPAERPVVLLNLLKFKSDVEARAGGQSGRDAYSKYSDQVSAAFARVGGKLLHFGAVKQTFSLGPSADWDAAILTRYPSPRALADFWLDDEFVRAHSHRVDGVERSQVMILSS